MESEFIDLLYENEAVEGIAIFTASGKLTENQLALNDAAVLQIFSSLNKIKSGLKAAEREMKGFVFKTNKYLLQAIVHGDLLILLQLSPKHSLDNTHTKIISQLGEIAPSPTPPKTTTQVTKTVVKEPVSTEEPAAESQIAWDVFHGSLLSLLKRVAPYAVAKKMIDSAALNEGFAAGENQNAPLETAFTIGQHVIDKIPNASRRKLLQKEYDLMIKQY